MPKTYALLAIVCAFFQPVFGAAAATAKGEAAKSASKGTSSGSFWKKGWGATSATEASSSLDRKGRRNGYELESDLEISKKVTESWDVLGGVGWKRYRREDLDYNPNPPAPKPGKKKKPVAAAAPSPQFESRNYITEFSGGARNHFRAAGLKWEGDWLYHRVWEEADKRKNGYNGFLTGELKSKIPMNAWSRTKVRFKYTEFMRTRSGEFVDKRQTKLEVSPYATRKDFSLGLQNQLVHRFKVGGSRSSVGVAPFLKYEHKIVEFTLKVAFLPFVSNDSQIMAPGWSDRPVYSAGMEINL